MIYHSKTHMTDNQINWDNYWQGRTAVDAGAALVGVENNPEISGFWDERLSSYPKEGAALDLACGAGTVAGSLRRLSFIDVSGADISSSAIAVMKESLPDVKGVVAPLEALPFKRNSFRLIVSQFGFEYGQHDKVVEEISRLLANGGEFLALSHKTDGAIHDEVKAKSEQMVAIKKSRYLEVTRNLFEATFSDKGPDAIKDIAISFREKRAEVQALAETPKGFAVHLLNGTQDLFQRRASLGLEAMLSWLDEMEHEMDRFIGRMVSMDKAALDDQSLSAIEAGFRSFGVEPRPREILRDSRGHDLGWIISAYKNKT